jgi:hypothetical protein
MQIRATGSESKTRVALASVALLLLLFAAVAPAFHSEPFGHDCAVCRLASVIGDQVTTDAAPVALTSVAVRVAEGPCPREAPAAWSFGPPRAPPA